MSRLAERHPLSLFLLLTFASSWTLWIASGAPSHTGEVPPDASWLVAQIGVFAPALPAVLLGAALTSSSYSDLRRVDAPWTFLAVLVAVAALIVLGRGRNRVEPWPLGEARGPAVARWTLGAILAPVTVLAAGFLLSHPGEVPSAIVPVAPVRAGGSLLPAIAFHTVINAVPDFALVAPAGYEAAVATFFVVGLVLAVAVVSVDPVMLRRPTVLNARR